MKRAGRLLLSAPQLAARVPGLRGVMRWDRRSSFSGKGGPNDGWLTSTANSGSGPASLVRRLASISLRPALRIRERNNDLRRGPDLRGSRGFGGRPVSSLIVAERQMPLVESRSVPTADGPSGPAWNPRVSRQLVTLDGVTAFHESAASEPSEG